jgi:diguanylate cyclase (GGDEF)-like protein
MFDVDGLSRVNEASGHAAGDAVLRSLARRLEAVIGPAATAARVGADEFAVLLDAGSDEALQEATRLREAVAGSYETLDGHVHLTLSAGAATSDGDVDGTDLLVRAGLALEAARAAGGACSHGFEPALLEAAVERGRLADERGAALGRGQRGPHYPPIVGLDGGRTGAVEALVRWQHPEQGLLPPARFLPHIEDTPLVLEMGRQVLRRACRDAAGWRARHPDHADLTVTVNVAARQLAEDSLVDDVRDALAAAGLPPRALTIEVTETAAMRDALATRDRLQELRALGVRIAIDDFGTGHSSLSYLRRFDVDVLKIAKEFVDVVGQDEQQDAFAATLVRLGELLGLAVVAEGIEEPVQAARLRAVGCPLGQGYLFSRPVDAAGVDRLLDGRLAA